MFSNNYDNKTVPNLQQNSGVNIKHVFLQWVVNCLEKKNTFVYFLTVVYQPS